MSVSSGNGNSGSPQKGFFKRMLGQDQSKSDRQMEVKQRHPGFTVSNEVAVTPGRTVRPQEVIISPAVKQLNKEGYVVYNTPEKQDIYITIQPDSAFFDDEEPKMVKMAGGSFVSADKRSSSVSIPVRPEAEVEPIAYTQPSDIFSNASRREVYGEIDFNEIIIKKNESFETEFEESPMFFKPYENDSEAIVEESLKITAIEMAATASAEVKIEESQNVSIKEYSEEPEYEVEEVSVEKAIVTEVPAGLYTDGRLPIDSAEAGVEKTSELSFFMGSVPAETAVTSESAVVDIVTPLLEELPIAAEEEPVVEMVSGIATEERAETVTDVPAQSEVIADVVIPLLQAEPLVMNELEPAPEMVCETDVMDATETVTNAPVQIEVVDEVADIMRITIPDLRMSDVLILELAEGWEKVIPDDGLEAYDCIFKSMKMQVGEDVTQAPCSSGFTEQKP